MTKSINDTPLNSAYETDEQGAIIFNKWAKGKSAR